MGQGTVTASRQLYYRFQITCRPGRSLLPVLEADAWLSRLPEATGPREQKQKLSLQLALGSCGKVFPLSVSGGI